MKKSLFMGIALLSVGFAFVSCSKTDSLDDNRAAFVENQKSEYRANFEAKYGKVDPNQSWDFSGYSGVTRAGETMTVSNISDPESFQQYLHTDKAGIKAALEDPNITAKTWNPYVSVNMYPAFCSDETKKNAYFRLKVNYNSNSTNVSTVQIKNNAWWGNNGATAPSQKGKGVNTMGLQTANNVSWKLEYIPKKGDPVSVNISTYKEIIVNGRTYWCFDYDDATPAYTELIYMVTPAPYPITKRYFVEDLGSKDDFDFNDVVFDVSQDATGKQKCIIRAMGGTLDFTLKIADKAVWTKSVEGAAENYVVETMYNTEPTPIWDKKLAEFDVTGWDPQNNNIKVLVKTFVSDNVIIEIPFPKTGEVPMIIAVKGFVNWQLERVSLPQDWWYIPEYPDLNDDAVLAAQPDVE